MIVLQDLVDQSRDFHDEKEDHRGQWHKGDDVMIDQHHRRVQTDKDKDQEKGDQMGMEIFA